MRPGERARNGPIIRKPDNFTIPLNGDPLEP